MKMILYRLSKKIIVSALVFSFIIGLKFLKLTTIISQINTKMQFYSTAVPEGHQPNKSTVSLAPVFSHLYFCPLCFGLEMCDKVMKNSVLFHGELIMSHNPRVVWKKGILLAQRVLVSSLIAEEWNRFDEFICRNASHSVPCDLSDAVWKTVLAFDNLLFLEKFRNLNAILDIPFNQFVLPVCSTKKLLKELKKSFDENFDGHFSKEERIKLITSLIMQPGYVILKLQAITKMTMPLPNLLGACGRSVVLEGGLKPLKSYLLESFDTRAELAIQVLQLVEDFENMHDFSCH